MPDGLGAAVAVYPLSFRCVPRFARVLLLHPSCGESWLPFVFCSYSVFLLRLVSKNALLCLCLYM